MNSNWPDIFFSVVIFQLLFLSFYLLSSETGRRTGNILLGSFFLAIFLNLLDSFLVLKKVYWSAPAWGLWSGCLPLLFGPFLFLYSQSVLYKDFQFRKRKWLHFLPFIICFLFTETAYLLLSRQNKLVILQDLIDRKIPTYTYWASAFIFLHFFIYAWACFRLITKFRKEASERFSDTDRNNISWLSSTLVFFVILMILGVMNSFVSLTSFARYYYFVLLLVMIGLMVFLNRILLKAMRKPEIFSIMEENPTPEEKSDAPKYAGSALSEADKQNMAGRLKTHMETARPYLDAELSLEQLAGELSVRPKLLSQVINEVLHQNFFDFVNRYRIDHARKLLANPPDKKMTVLEILYESGFNSKSSFNTLFKKYTGLTPSEFKKNNRPGEVRL